MRVVCTAGHVDHGKSSLVRALTGHEPDRLAEEQRRGLTIDLGFAWTDLDGAGRVAFVDLPGHERFVPTMLAGAGPVRLCLFVVAADEGVMPQTAEHLTILDLLGVDGGVIALSRADLADELTRMVAREEVEDAVAGTVLEGAPIIEVSSTTGDGLDAVRAALADLLRDTAPPADDGVPRLWVDRAFSVRGAGTVVTGTLGGGPIAVGDELAVLPGGPGARVRGLQALGESVDRARPGWRVAINLVGVAVDQVGRGDAVGAPTWRATDEVSAWYTPAAGAVIGRRGAWTAHVGTAAVPVAVHPVAGADLHAPGPVRLELARRLPLAVGDRVVLRESGRVVTAGGAIVIDPAPVARARGRDRRALRVQQLTEAAAVVGDGGAADRRLAALLGLHPVLEVDRACALAACTPADVPEDVEVVAGRWLVTDTQWVQWSGLAITSVASWHQRHPALGVAPSDQPRTLLEQAGCTIADGVLDHLVALDRLERAPGGYRVPGHQPRLTAAQQQARERLTAALDDHGVSPPPLAEVAASAGADDDLLHALLAEDQLHPLVGLPVAVSDRTWVGAVAALGQLPQPFTAAQARDALGTSRKFVLPLLEALDRAGVTTRDGDVRTLT